MFFSTDVDGCLEHAARGGGGSRYEGDVYEAFGQTHEQAHDGGIQTMYS